MRTRMRHAALAALCVGPAVLALPPSPELGEWNEDPAKLDGTVQGRNAYNEQLQRRRTWNCYNYGVNTKTFDDGGKAVRAHPGKGQKWPGLGKATLTRQQMCDKAKARAKRDNLVNITWAEGDPIPTPPDGYNLVALGATPGIKGGGSDYHWWRLNGDGTWSHKRGPNRAKTTYTDAAGDEQPLTDPRDAAQRDGYSLCCFMGVPKNPAPNVGPLAVASSCGPGPGRTVVTQVVMSGYDDFEMHLTSIEVQELAAFLPTFATGNEVPDPGWSGVPAGQGAGYEIAFDPLLSPQLPDYLRVNQGVAEVLHYRPDLDAWNLYFYADDNGLEAHLDDTFKPAKGACCDLEGACGITSPCTCATMGGTYRGDGVTCSDKAAVCAGDCPWDLDGDALVGIEEFLTVLALWDEDPGGPPDFDGDGTVGIVDLLTLLGHWGPCPKGPG